MDNTLLAVALLIVAFMLLKNNNQKTTIIRTEAPHVPRYSRPIRPVTYATQRVEPFRQIGFLYSEDGQEEMMPLLGRRVHNGSTNWNYYTLTNHEIPIKIPIFNKKRNCMNEYGCDELYNEDKVYIQEFNKHYIVRIYESQPIYYYR